MSGRLVICATPIGNLGDASPRLSEALRDADVVFAEDTRRSGNLLRALGIEAELRSYFAGNEEERAAELEQRLASGQVVALMTDAGVPGIADPGVSAVRVARRAGAGIGIVPGPSAVTTAVAVSGFGGDRFVFEGFLPRKGRSRREALERLAGEPRTTVVLASPHRLRSDLGDLAAVLGGERQVCVCRELTKLHEEIWWGGLSEAVEEWTRREPRGEFTLVLEASPPLKPGIEQAVEEARRLMGLGVSRSDAAREAAAATGVRRREVYERLG